MACIVIFSQYNNKHLEVILEQYWHSQLCRPVRLGCYFMQLTKLALSAHLSTYQSTQPLYGSLTLLSSTELALLFVWIFVRQ